MKTLLAVTAALALVSLSTLAAAQVPASGSTKTDATPQGDAGGGRTAESIGGRTTQSLGTMGTKDTVEPGGRASDTGGAPSARPTAEATPGMAR